MAERSERAGFVALLIAGQFHHHNACDDEGSGEQAHRRCEELAARSVSADLLPVECDTDVRKP